MYVLCGRPLYLLFPHTFITSPQTGDMWWSTWGAPISVNLKHVQIILVKCDHNHRSCLTTKKTIRQTAGDSLLVACLMDNRRRGYKEGFKTAEWETLLWICNHRDMSNSCTPCNVMGRQITLKLTHHSVSNCTERLRSLALPSMSWNDTDIQCSTKQAVDVSSATPSPSTELRWWTALLIII